MFNWTNAKALIELIAPDLVRVKLGPQGIFLEDPSWAVFERDWPKFEWEVKELQDFININTPELNIFVQKKPFMIPFMDKSGDMINRDAIPETVKHFFDKKTVTALCHGPQPWRLLEF